jgi:hypothetical protein
MKFGTRAKGDPRKTELAARLREETPMPRQWIAKRLAMGSASYIKGLSIVRIAPFLSLSCHLSEWSPIRRAGSGCGSVANRLKPDFQKPVKFHPTHLPEIALRKK